MSLIAKPPTLVMLAGALWLTAVDLAVADTPGSKRDFVALVANRQNQLIASRLQHQLTQLNAASTHLFHQQNSVTSQIITPPPPMVLVKLNRLDERLQEQSTRILERLQKINNLVASGSQNATALNRLRNDLTRQESIVGQRIQTVRRFERAAATPSAPGGF